MTFKLSDYRVWHSSYPGSSYGPHLFNLNKQVSGISIPDQMRRGYYAALEAMRLKYIGPGKPLLIIGAGVAGLMAGMTAVQRHEVPTWIIEMKRVLATQANCGSRYVCPTQYDWPATTWNRGYYPFDNEPMPFSWRQGLVASVVKRIVEREVEKFLESELFNIVTGAKFIDYTPARQDTGDVWVSPYIDYKPPLPHIVDKPPPPPDIPRSFAMALACAGFGEENTTLEPRKLDQSLAKVQQTDGPTSRRTIYVGHKFWELDTYENQDPLLGMNSNAIPNIMISGSGDGALQDFLRIATRPAPTGQESNSAGALYLHIFKSLNDEARGSIEKFLLETEQGLRQDNEVPASDPADRRRKRCLASRKAHNEHLLIINKLRKEAAWPEIVKALDSIVRDFEKEIKIKVVYPCDHVTAFYGLNRFLALLIGSYIETKYQGVQVFHPQKTVTCVVASSANSGYVHHCADAETCHGEDHQVFCASGDCLDFDREWISEEHELEGGPYNAVIIRHGIDKRTVKDLLGRY